MAQGTVKEILRKQQEYFRSGKTLPLNTRIHWLKKLYQAISVNEKAICAALEKDLGKSDYEGFMCEVGLVKSELSFMIRNLKKYAKKHIVYTPLAQFASVSYTQNVPYGNVLVMSPWNYPILLSIDPVTDAIAAGNTVILKPSAYSPATSEIMRKIISETLPSELAAVITGGREENAQLLDEKFDFIFFTGSQMVGKEVLKKAAEHLTPVVLELGGKSPCIVDSTAKIKLAAKRIVFGKYLNCGQTCVAPDYILCDEKIKDQLLEELVKQVHKQYGKDPFQNRDYGRIVNQKHLNRLKSLLDPMKIVIGGKVKEETLQLEPTIMDQVTWEDAVMQEEIFGPILPILTYSDFNEVYEKIEKRTKPLALYLFSEDKKRIREVTGRIRYGGGCINDTVIHLATSEMGFGGVGESGMGSYHGKAGFEAFSHKKSILDKKTWMDLPMRYQPYHRALYSKLLHLFLK